MAEPTKAVSVGEDIIVRPKFPFASTSWWGSLTAILAFVFAWLVRTHRLPAEIEQPVRDLSLDVVAGIIAAAVAMYGRWRATRPLGIGGPMKTTVKVLAPLLLALSLAGCANLSVPADWVKAERKTYDAVAPEYSDYVNNDASLSALQKANRQNDVKSWESRIVEHEKATAEKAGK